MTRLMARVIKSFLHRAGRQQAAWVTDWTQGAEERTSVGGPRPREPVRCGPGVPKTGSPACPTEQAVLSTNDHIRVSQDPKQKPNQTALSKAYTEGPFAFRMNMW